MIGILIIVCTVCLEVWGEVNQSDVISNKLLPILQPFNQTLDGVFSVDHTLLALELQSTWLSLEYGTFSNIRPKCFDAQCSNLAIAYPLVYVAGESTGLEIFDFSSTINPRSMSSYTKCNPKDVVVNASIAFLADQSGLMILNVSNTSSPYQMNDYVGTPSAPPMHVILSPSKPIVFLSDPNEVLIFDVSNLKKPILLSTYRYHRKTKNYGSIALSSDGNTLWIAELDTSLVHVVNVSDPEKPSFLDMYTPRASVHDMYVADELLFLAESSMIEIVNISRSSNRTKRVEIKTSPTAAIQLKIVKNLILVAGTTELAIYDISDLDKSALMGKYSLGGTNWMVGAIDALSEGAVILINNNFRVMACVDLSNGVLLGLPPGSLAGQQINVKVNAYNDSVLVQQAAFMVKIDQSPIQISTLPSTVNVFPGAPLQYYLHSDGLFTNPLNNFLQLSISRLDHQPLPSWMDLKISPTWMSGFNQFPLSGQCTSLAVSGNLAFVTYLDSGLSIIDVTNLKRPQYLSSFPAQDRLIETSDVVVDGNVVYLADLSAGLYVLNITNPSNPRVINAEITTSFPEGIALKGDMVFTAQGYQDLGPNQSLSLLGVFDRKNATNLQKLSPLRWNCSANGNKGGAQAISISGNTAFISDFNCLTIVDVSIASSPTLVRSETVPSGAHVHTSTILNEDNILFVPTLNSSKNVLFINISDLKISGFIAIGDFAGNYIALKGTTLFLVNGTSLNIFDVSSLTDPLFLGSSSLNAACKPVIIGNTAFINDASGLVIQDLSQWRLAFNPSTSDFGNYEFQLTVKDELGGITSTPFTVRVEGPPVFNNVSLPVAFTEEPYNSFISQEMYSDPNNDPIIWSATIIKETGTQTWLHFNPGSATFAGTPGKDDYGNYTILLNASDNIAGSTNATLFFYVDAVPYVKIPIASQNLFTGRYWKYDLSQTFSDRDGDTLVLSNSSAPGTSWPSWLTFDNGTIFGTPNSQGFVTLYITATDTHNGAVSVPIYLSISPIYPLSVVQQISDQSISVTTPMTFFVPHTEVFYNPSGDNLTFSAENLPEWLTFNPNSVSFVGTPERKDTNNFKARTHTITLIATDDETDQSVSTNFDLHVEGPTDLEIFIYALGSVLSALIIISLFWLHFEKQKSHREHYRFANEMRLRLNLKYHDFTSYEGEIYKSTMMSLENKISQARPEFFRGAAVGNDHKRRDFCWRYPKQRPLTNEQKLHLDFVQEVLDEEHYVFPADCFSRGKSFCCYCRRGVKELDLRELNSSLDDIADEVIKKLDD